MRIVVGQGSLHINDAEEINIEIDKLIMHPNWEWVQIIKFKNWIILLLKFFVIATEKLS